MTRQEVQVAMKRKSLRALGWAIVGVASLVTLFLGIVNAPQSNGVAWPLRRVLEMNGWIAMSASRNTRLAEKPPASEVIPPARVNGSVGMEDDFDPSTWVLHLVGGRQDTITLADIKKLPTTDVVTKFKCVEGWSQVIQAKGVRMSDFLAAYGPTLPAGQNYDESNLGNLPKWVGLKTPNGRYYVGIDMKSALHPQTILAWEMDGKPLPMDQGKPLRLVIPIKYGIKSIKRIGTITLTNTRPPDYWFERGYDYYAGH